MSAGAQMPTDCMVQNRAGNETLISLHALCLCLGLTLPVVVPVSAMAVGIEKAVVLGIGVAALLALTIQVLFRKEYDLFEPNGFAVLNTLMGVTLQCLYMVCYDTEKVRAMSTTSRHTLWGKRSWIPWLAV